MASHAQRAGPRYQQQGSLRSTTGIAWDPSNGSKTAVRNAGRIFSRYDAGTLGNLFFNPPAVCLPRACRRQWRRRQIQQLLANRLLANMVATRLSTTYRLRGQRRSKTPAPSERPAYGGQLAAALARTAAQHHYLMARSSCKEPDPQTNTRAQRQLFGPYGNY